jgi:iron complex outermembrane receptor protein
MKSYPIIFSILVICHLTCIAQNGTISGTVRDNSGPLELASVIIHDSTTGASTDVNGRFSFDVIAGTYNVSASYIGYATQTISVTVSPDSISTLDFHLIEGVMVDEIIITGTRSSNRTKIESAVPIDVINVAKLTSMVPQTNVNQLLHITTPSFSSNTQTISDGTDHIDPASLRGLGPDQVLVLINGKRRHTSSLININGTFGRGNVGTDLNAIPASAIGNLEVLRDGAAAQYGSDAIAGVINLRLKENLNALQVNITSGANFTSRIGPFDGKTKSQDGEVVNVGLNYGLPIGNNGGFINFTGEFGFRGSTNRMLEFEGSIFNRLNSVERIASARGVDISSWTRQGVIDFASDVSYFDENLRTQISDLDLSTPTGNDNFISIFGADATDSELAARNQVRSDFNMRVGQSELREGKFFANMIVPLAEGLELYTFGGTSYRNGISGCFYRLPSQNRTTTAIYPDGTVPKINSNIYDQSISAGIRGQLHDWNIDFSNVYGSNKFLFFMTDTHNATLGASSPTEFNSGGHAFTQNTSNFDVSQYFNLSKINGMNVAFGFEYRYENYKVIAGSEQSWGNYDINGNLVSSITPDEWLTTDLLGRGRPSGAQCFAGFLPSNEADANRSSAGAYFDVEFDVSDKFLINSAIRYENYSDFGSSFNYKLASRYKFSDDFALRGAVSTGFRAPSLHQIHFSRTSTVFELINGVSVPTERGTFANNSRAAKLLGIPELKQETSQNLSLGFTGKFPDTGLRFTVDAYQVNIDDRIVLTGAFSAGNDLELQTIFDQAQAVSAAFFANAISTKSKGIDIVISHQTLIGNGSLRSDLAMVFSQTLWDQDQGINASVLLEEKGLIDTFFDQNSRIYLEQSVPRKKFTFSNTCEVGKLNVYLRNTYFGQTTEATNENIFDADLNLIDDSIDPYNEPKLLTDLSFGYHLSKSLTFTIGGNNIFDVFPDEVDPAFRSSGRFIYSRRAPQFSFGGRHLFTRLLFTM